MEIRDDHRNMKVALSLVLAACCSQSTHAELQPRLGGAAVYDTDQNITWLANANLAASNTFGTAGVNADGTMSWYAAANWITSMNAAKYLGFSTWRLPVMPTHDPTCSSQETDFSSGFNCTGSEMGHLFYIALGGVSNMGISQAHNSNYDLFTKIQEAGFGHYWTSNTFSRDPSGGWVFAFYNGQELADPKASPHFIWPVLTGDVAASSVLPQFAFGGGWYSVLYFTNTGSSAVSFQVRFIADTGLPLNVPSVGGTSTTVNLAAGGTGIIEAPNSGPLNQGYVSLSLPVGVQAYGVFRQSVPGVADQEAVVPLSSAFSTDATLIWDDTNFTTAVAIVNPSAVAAVMTITVKNSNGQIVGTSSMTLPASSKTEGALRSFPGLTAMAGNRGSADFAVATGNVAVLGLRFSGTAFTSIPTVQK